MNWNYRVVRKETQWGPEFSIKEFYYNAAGEIWGWTENDERPYGDSVEEVASSLRWMLEACERPVVLQTELDSIIEQHKRDAPPEDDAHLISQWEDEGGSIGS